MQKKNLEEHSNEIIRKLKVLDENWYGGEIAKKKRKNRIVKIKAKTDFIAKIQFFEQF